VLGAASKTCADDEAKMECEAEAELKPEIAACGCDPLEWFTC
jgi:hypothetical protein